MGYNKKLLGIQYLRGIAVILVVLCHITGMARFEKYFNRDLLNGFFITGAVGVELFFVISGFIITYVSLNVVDFKPKVSLRDFFSRRFTRIIPFMWVCVFGYAALRFLGRGTFPFVPYLKSLVLYPIGNLQPNQIWTLRHEFLFYVVFGLTIIYLRSKWFYLILWFLSPFFWYGLGINDFLPESDFKQLCNFFFKQFNILFGIGCLVSYLYSKDIINLRIKTNYGLILCVFASSFLFIAAGYVEVGESSLNFTRVLVCGLVSFIIVIFGLTIYTESPLSYLDKIGLILGDASYSIYLTHSAIISTVLGLWSRYQPNANSVLILLVITILSCIGGILVHNFIEKPIIAFFQNKSRKSKVEVSTS